MRWVSILLLIAASSANAGIIRQNVRTLSKSGSAGLIGNVTLSGGLGVDLVQSSQNISITPTVVAPIPLTTNNIDWSMGNVFTKTLTTNTVFTFSGRSSGQTIVVRITNTGNSTVTWPTVMWSGGTPVSMTAGSHADVFTFIYDGTDVYGSAVQNY